MPKSNIVDWSIPKVLIYKDGTKVLSTGTFTESCFSGVCVESGDIDNYIGEYSNSWDKSQFNPIITFHTKQELIEAYQEGLFSENTVIDCEKWYNEKFKI